MPTSPITTPGVLEWQPGLFGGAGQPGRAGEPDGAAYRASGSAHADAPDFTRIRRTSLEHGAWVDHAPGWLPDPDPLFAAMVSELPWKGAEVEMYGRTVAQPRLSAWWKLGVEPPDVPSAHRATELAAAVDAYYCVGIDAIGCNLYRDGADSVAFHGDRHARNPDDPDAVVAIVSLGSARRFRLRPKGGGPSRCYTLHPGDLLVMGGSCQRTWEHAIPKAATAGPRISVTFRHPVR